MAGIISNAMKKRTAECIKPPPPEEKWGNGEKTRSSEKLKNRHGMHPDPRKGAIWRGKIASGPPEDQPGRTCGTKRKNKKERRHWNHSQELRPAETATTRSSRQRKKSNDKVKPTAWGKKRKRGPIEEEALLPLPPAGNG